MQEITSEEQTKEEYEKFARKVIEDKIKISKIQGRTTLWYAVCKACTPQWRVKAEPNTRAAAIALAQKHYEKHIKELAKTNQEETNVKA